MLLSHGKRYFLIGASLCALVAHAAPSRSTVPKAAPSPSPDLANRLQAYFIDSRKELGTLESWQQRLFDEEAAPEYQRFIRDYRVSKNPMTSAGAPGTNTGIAAEIDFESLKRFLRFYAPKSLKRDKPPIAVILRPQMQCSKCVSSLPEVKALVSARLDRRGFKPIWVAPAELGASTMSDADVDAAASQISLQKKAVGTLLVSWQSSLDEVDSSHPDEHHYVIRSLLDVRDISKSQAQLELNDTGNFEKSAGKLLSDAFTELGGRMEELEVSQSELKREEILVDVIGIRSFAQYQKVKNGIQSVLKSGASLEEQKISRGRAIFAVFSAGTAQKIQQAIAGAKMDGLRFSEPTLQDNEIHLEVMAVESAPARAPQPAENKGDPEA